MRWLVVAVVLGLALAGVILLASKDPQKTIGYPPCFFRKVTGFACPGCGMTRAGHAMLKGRIVEALRWNPLGALLLPVALVGLGLELLSWAMGCAGRWRLFLGWRFSGVCAVVVIAFWILRNTPAWPWPLTD